MCRSIILHENPVNASCRQQRARLLKVMQYLVLVCMSVEVPVDTLKTTGSSPSDCAPHVHLHSVLGALFKHAVRRRSSDRRVTKVDDGCWLLERSFRPKRRHASTTPLEEWQTGVQKQDGGTLSFS